MEHLHDDGVVVVLELVVDVVRRRRAHDAWRCLALHDDAGDGRHGDVDVDDLRLHLVCAPKMMGGNTRETREKSLNQQE